MDFHESELESGARVVTESMPSVRSAAIGFWIGIGSRDETGPAATDGDDSGASHFLEHLLFKGTERRTAKEIAETIDAVGGDLNAFTSKEYTCFYARVLDRDLPVACDVLSDMVATATISEEDVDQERNVVLEEINIHHDTPEDLVHSDFARLILDDHPLAREVLGTEESIATMSREVVHGYFTRNYRPANLTVAAAGNVDHPEVVSLVERMVGDLSRPGGQQPDRHGPSAYATGEVHVRERPTEQAHVVLGAPGLTRDDDRRFALLVLNTLLGGGMSARLFQEIRERRGLAYSTYSYHSAYSNAGYAGCYAGTTPAKVDELCKVLRSELDRLPDTLERDEVEHAKGNVTGSIVLGMEDTGSRMTRVGKMFCTGAELLTIDEAIRRVESVDVDDVREVAREVYGAPRSLAVVGPFAEPERFRGFVA